MREYERFECEKDFIKHSPYLYYFLGKVKDENITYVLASYSVKTKRLIIKDAINFDFFSHGQALGNFIAVVEKYHKENYEQKDNWENVD